MIEINNLNKSFEQVAALSNINLSIQEGEIFGIIGKSGAGKSTLLRCMNLLERPDSGQVIINNKEITQLNATQLNKARYQIGMIFQHFNLLSSQTVYDNIALPSRIQGISEEVIRAKINEILPLVGLSHKELAYPHELSGGQKQRVAIARALSYSPKILLCDEATSALNPETTESILQLLKAINLKFGITVVIITHEMDVIKKICHRLAVMEHGQIVELNTLADLFEDEQSQARHWLFDQLNPKLPDCLINQISLAPTEQTLLKIVFQGEAATLPFISQTSRSLSVDINILLADIDRFDTVSCGVLVIELSASPLLLDEFITRCKQAKLTVEILGYVNGSKL